VWRLILNSPVSVARTIAARCSPPVVVGLAGKHGDTAEVNPRRFRFGGGMIPVQSRAEWVRHAKQVEELGYSTLWMGQHPAWGGIEPTVALMAAADATTTLRVASHVFTNDLHHPVLLAQAATTIDVLSGGRLEFGLGAGWLPADYSTCGLPFHPASVRVGRLEEAVRIVKALWANDATSLAGPYYEVSRPEWQLRPQQKPHPPIFLGGAGRRMLTLAAREADIVGLGGDPALATPEASTDAWRGSAMRLSPAFPSSRSTVGLMDWRSRTTAAAAPRRLPRSSRAPWLS